MDTTRSKDEGVEKKKFSRFRMLADDTDVQFELGMIFNSKFEVKEAMKTFSMTNKKNLVVKYNDLTRFVVRCMSSCPFLCKG